MSSNVFDRIAFISLLVTIGLLPLFFLPFTNIPIETSKTLLVMLGLGLTAVCWSIARFFDGRLDLPRSWVLFSLLFLTLAALGSALASPAVKWSLFGVLLDVGSFSFFVVAFFLSLLTGIYTRSRGGWAILGALSLSIFALFVFQLARLVSPDMLSFGVLAGKTGNLFGSWNNVGLLAGLAVIISIFKFDLAMVGKLHKTLLFVFVVISIALMLIINFSLSWGLLAVFALVVFVVKILQYVRNRQTEAAQAVFPLLSLLVLIFALMFLLSGVKLQSYLPTKLAVLNSELRPNFESTLEVGKGALTQSPIFGVGPSRFSEAWALYKPQNVNDSQFWNTPFDFGSGLIPTFFITLGAVGIMGFLLLFVFLLRDGVRGLFGGTAGSQSGGAALFFILSAYLLTAAFLYPVGISLLFLTFIMLGGFAGSYAREAGTSDISVSFLEDPRKSFFAIIFLVLFIIAAILLSFKFAVRFSGAKYYTDALASTDIVQGQALISEAVSRNPNDLFLRTKSQIYLARLGVEAEKITQPSEELAKELQNVFDIARDSAAEAVAYNPKNFLNFQAQGALYEIAGSVLGVEDSYSRALAAYQSAEKLNPRNPGLKLAVARMYWILDQKSDAKELIRQAMEIKPNFVDGFIFQAQIARSEGDLATARALAEQAIALDPNNQELINYVNSLNVGTQ